MEECDLVTVGHFFLTNPNNVDVEILLNECVKPAIQGSKKTKQKDKAVNHHVRMGKPFAKKEVEPQDGSDKCHRGHAHCVTTHQSNV